MTVFFLSGGIFIFSKHLCNSTLTFFTSDTPPYLRSSGIIPSSERALFNFISFLVCRAFLRVLLQPRDRYPRPPLRPFVQPFVFPEDGF